MSARVFLPGDPLPGAPSEYAPSEHGGPPIAAMLGTALDNALLLLEARRWFLDDYHLDHPMRDAEVEAIGAAIAAVERALEYHRRCCATWPR